MQKIRIKKQLRMCVKTSAWHVYIRLHTYVEICILLSVCDKPSKSDQYALFKTQNAIEINNRRKGVVQRYIF